MSKYKSILYSVLYGAGGLWTLLTLLFMYLNLSWNWFATWNWMLISILVICYIGNKIVKLWLK